MLGREIYPLESYNFLYLSTSSSLTPPDEEFNQAINPNITTVQLFHPISSRTKITSEQTSHSSEY
jgi:hypothetical protein